MRPTSTDSIFLVTIFFVKDSYELQLNIVSKHYSPMQGFLKDKDTVALWSGTGTSA